MSETKLRKGCILALAVYMVLAVAFYLVTGDQLRFKQTRTESITPGEPVGELVQGLELRQGFTAQGDEILDVSMLLSTYARENTARVVMEVVGEDGAVLGRAEVPCAGVADNEVRTVPFEQPVPVREGRRYELVLTSPDGAPGNAITAWLGNTVSTARADIPVEILDKLLVNGQARDGMLHVSFQFRSYLWFGQVYWYLAAAAGAALAVYCVYLCRMARRGKSCLALRLISAFQRYSYLMRQLVARDFKTKYKRSVLGVLWSFLNPLLTMLVQYIVFSTLFRSDIPNFAVYLLTGIVCFNFFSEATTMALTSIVGNAALITKVYVPKYIYPLTRVISSTVNFLLSLVPLLVMLLVTQTPIRPAVLLMPVGVLCLFAVSLGIGMLLASAMVFFRDTQFLWGVLSMLWMYATPIIYPESIIPASIMPIYKCNPLYHIIRFVRIVLMEGVSPEPKAYAIMFVASLVPLILGVLVFKKNQDRFVLHI